MVARQPNWFCLLARWTARIVSVLLVLMVLAFLVGDGVPAVRGLAWTQLCQFAAFAVVLAGLLAAWRWELAGATAALIGLGVFEAIEFAVRRGFAFGAFPWFAVPAVLYLLASWLERAPVASRPRGY
jgi:hypothetical protein